MRTEATVALGGNVGAVLQTFARALRLLAAALGPLRGLSAAYLTRPHIAPGQPLPAAYWNAVCRLGCVLPPLAVLSRLKAIERACGRRPAGRWAPRPLDLDLLLLGQRPWRSRLLQVPHPRLAQRAFVLQPLADLYGEQPLPGLRRTAPALLQQLGEAGRTEILQRRGGAWAAAAGDPAG